MSIRRAAVVAALAAALALLAIAGPAAAAPAWRDGGRVQSELFSAQSELLLGGPGSTVDRVDRARRFYRGELARGLRADAPDADRRVRRALREARAAALRRDDVRLAAARGTLRAALLGGAYRVTLAAVAGRDAATAEDWLLLREFRRTTRFTRPGIDATNAVKGLASGDVSARAASLAVKKDLLDAYQSRLLDALNDAEAANKRDFAARRAEEAAQAHGYWLILAPEHRRQLGAAASRSAAAAFSVLDANGAHGGPGFDRALESARKVLQGFTAAPFTTAEQARRATQLVRFLDLVPVEYGRGVEGRRVTKAFEVQEAIAFRDGAESAFADLEAALTRRDARDAETVQRSLERLQDMVEAAGTGGKVATKGEIEAVHKRAKAALGRAVPKSWKQSSTESDFDLIDLTLDRVDAAVAAGEWKQAEQARLEAYAFFEFGPELRLKAFDPQLSADVEGLVWFGARGEKGMASLISSHGGEEQFRATRAELDRALTQAKETLGDESSSVTVAVNAAVIVFREGLEAVLILAAVTASLLGANARLRRPVLLGALCALPATAVLFVLAQTVLDSLSRYGEKLEAVVGLIALAVLLVVMNWFLHKVYWTGWIQKHHARRRRLLQAAEGGFLSAQVLGLAMLGFTSVFREGFETVLFLQALELAAGPVVVLEGVLLGLLATAVVGVITFFLERHLPYKRMLIVTGVMIGFVLIVMTGNTVRTLQGVGWMPITSFDVQFPYWVGLWFGIFPTVETVLSQVLAAGFVIGSYFLAERMRKPGRRRRETPSRFARDAPPSEANGNGSSQVEDHEREFEVHR
jgi:high-affinity iron transporter